MSALFVLLLLAQPAAGEEIELVDTATTSGEEPATSSEERLLLLESRFDELEAQFQEMKREREAERLSWSFSGYVDFGFFVPSGDGAGVVQDVGNRALPRFGERWVFLGDLLSTAVNSRGEVADLGNLPGVDRFDGIHSQGAAGFILNEVNFRLSVRSSRLAFVTSVNVVPRTGKDFALGDFLDLDLAQLEWSPTDDGWIRVYLGKIESNFGEEYRRRKADLRFGITPSLVARYTIGTPLGIKVRAHLFQDTLILAASLTNGSSGTEQFHFYDETDSNSGKTFTGRAIVRLPLPEWSDLFASGLSIGFSAQVGAQDRVRDSADAAWLIGADLEYVGSRLSLHAQWVKGRVPGRPADHAYALDLHGGAYLEVDVTAFAGWGVLARLELRDATVWLDGERVYRTQSWRATGGLRWTIEPNVTLKLEYLHNGEYGEVPELTNDVATSSLVVTY